MATAAERQRRSRAHKAGNHSLCDPKRCDGRSGTPVTGVTKRDVTQTVTEQALDAASQFGWRGRKLWDELNDGTRGPGEIVLIEEACRISDRLEKLDRLLRGDDATWITLRPDDDAGTYAVVIDQALTQARMHATTLRGLVAELRQSANSAKAPAGQGGSILDQLAAKRAARLANPTG